MREEQVHQLVGRGEERPGWKAEGGVGLGTPRPPGGAGGQSWGETQIGRSETLPWDFLAHPSVHTEEGGGGMYRNL